MFIKCPCCTHRISISIATSIKNKATFQDLLELVSDHYGIPQDRITGTSRQRQIKDARFALIYLANKYTDLSLSQIARKLTGDKIGVGKAPTTVLHALRTVKNLMETDEDIRQDITTLCDLAENMPSK